MLLLIRVGCLSFVMSIVIEMPGHIDRVSDEGYYYLAVSCLSVCVACLLAVLSVSDAFSSVCCCHMPW